MADVTQILAAVEAGNAKAATDLLPLVYDELRKLAKARMAVEAAGHTLQPTALVHEAYVRLIGPGADQSWNGRGHFFAAAAEAMRRILVDQARRKKSLKHGGGRKRVEPDEIAAPADDQSDELLSVSDALDDLAREDPVKAELVKLRYFAGLSVQDAADALGISRATADRYWAYAKVWLYRHISGEDKPAAG